MWVEPPAGLRPVAVSFLFAVVVQGCDSPPASRSPAARPFVERAGEVGLTFTHFNGMSGEHYIVEMMGPGSALFDYDRDGDLDVWLVQGVMLGPGKTLANAILPPVPPFPGDRLFRNLLRETGRLAFEDVTEAARIASVGYGMGVAVGDYDADGFPDVYVTRFGADALWRNRRDGTFEDVTDAAGVSDERWSTAAAFVDYDADDDLDLFVVNYVEFAVTAAVPCFTPAMAHDYCGPSSYPPAVDRLYRNRGDGTFEDVTGPSRIAQERGRGLGAVVSDLDGDGLVDLYVANDGDPNSLWINRGDGTFTDDGLIAGCALNRDGRAEGSMGVDAGDFDGDGAEDLFLTNLDHETNTLYRNDGRGRFDDVTARTGIGPPSIGTTGFGTAWLDWDNDGRLDLFVANGAIAKVEELVRRGDRHPLGERNQLFRQTPNGFEDVTDEAGPAFARPEVGRGAAFGDVDDDGDTDIVVSTNGGPVRLLVNEVGSASGWIGFTVVGETGRRDVLGAAVELVRPDGRSAWRRVRVAASYLSSNDPRVLFGLGSDHGVRAVRVHWPRGGVEEWAVPVIRTYTVLQRGTGTVLRAGSTSGPRAR